MAVDKLVDSGALDTAMTATANAIRTKTGDSSTIPWDSSTGFASAIGDIQTGGVRIVDTQDPNGGTVRTITTLDEIVYDGDADVIFYDYDGTVIKNYTKEEFLALESMPSNPSHEGLTAQGWNWSLSDAKAYVTNYGILNIGQMYVTDDGKTRIYITIPDTARGNMLKCSLYYRSQGMTLDWGDGSATVSDSTNTNKVFEHTYPAPGSYIITIKNNSGWIQSAGPFHNNSNIAKWVTKIELGSYVYQSEGAFFNSCPNLETCTMTNNFTKFGNSAFYYCYSLKFLVVGSSVNWIGYNSFAGCYALKGISIPKSTSFIGNANVFGGAASIKRICVPEAVSYLYNSDFTNMYSLREIVMPNTPTSCGTNIIANNACLKHINIPTGLTSLGNNFASGSGLVEVTIPSGITTIGSQAFYNCTSLGEVHFKPTNPPTLSNVNAFEGIPADCVFYVPSASLSAYQTAWSTYASRMVGE